MHSNSSNALNSLSSGRARRSPLACHRGVRSRAVTADAPTGLATKYSTSRNDTSRAAVAPQA